MLGICYVCTSPATDTCIHQITIEINMLEIHDICKYSIALNAIYTAQFIHTSIKIYTHYFIKLTSKAHHSEHNITVAGIPSAIKLYQYLKLS